MLLKLSVPMVVFDLDLPQIRACLWGFRGHLPQIGASKGLCLITFLTINHYKTVCYLKTNACNTGWPCCPLALLYCAQHKNHRLSWRYFGSTVERKEPKTLRRPGIWNCGVFTISVNMLDFSQWRLNVSGWSYHWEKRKMVLKIAIEKAIWFYIAVLLGRM